MARPLVLHPDRALPADPGTREVARRLYAETRSLPLVCMHGHVEARILAEDQPFPDPAQLFVVPDHYVTRMLLSQGVRLEDVGVPRQDGGPFETDPRVIWRRFCEHWHLFRGTPSRYWLEHELADLFGVRVQPSAETADAIYDRIAASLASPEYRPRALLRRFNIELISTTDPATSDLRYHESLRDGGLGDRVIPTFRPDAVVHAGNSEWKGNIEELGALTDVDTSTYAGYLEALRRQREVFAKAGGLATDHGHLNTDTTPLEPDAAERIYARALAGEVTADESEVFAAHMLFVMAGMSCDDGLVMQLHPGVLRDHHDETHRIFGSDKGLDIPVAAEFTRGLRPLLREYGHHPNFRLILFTVDETVYSRELAPLAGGYPAVRLGAPWWFLDSPDGMRRFRELATETAGFSNTAGFVDDTRAFPSIPARHDLARRIDAGHLARLVAEHRLSEEEAAETAVDLAYRLPKVSYQRVES